MSRRLILLLAALWLASLAGAYLIGHEAGEPDPLPCTEEQRILFDPACLDS